LRFTTGEAAAILNQMGQACLLRCGAEGTEGWIAGLQAAISMRGADITGFVKAFTGRPFFVAPDRGSPLRQAEKRVAHPPQA
jgi:hypothetical protein